MPLKWIQPPSMLGGSGGPPDHSLSVFGIARIGQSPPFHPGPRGQSVGSRARWACDFLHSNASNQKGIADQ